MSAPPTRATPVIRRPLAATLWTRPARATRWHIERVGRPALGGLLCLALWSCAVARSPERSATAKWAQTVDALRRSADVYVQAHQLGLAAADLQRIFALPRPKSAPAKAYQLLQDARFALGSVFLLQGRFDDALKEADAGLALGDDGSIFGANLHALRGLSREGQGRPLDALEDYAAAMAIHKRLFDATLTAHDAAKDAAPASKDR